LLLLPLACGSCVIKIADTGFGPCALVGVESWALLCCEATLTWWAVVLHMQVNATAAYISSWSGGQLSINNTYLTCDQGAGVPAAHASISTSADLAQALTAAATLANSSAPVMQSELQLLNSVAADTSSSVQFTTSSLSMVTFYAEVCTLLEQSVARASSPLFRVLFKVQLSPDACTHSRFTVIPM
jgi:hypothetical protein